MTPTLRHLRSGDIVIGDPDRHATPRGTKRDWPASGKTRAAVLAKAAEMRAELNLGDTACLRINDAQRQRSASGSAS